MLNIGSKNYDPIVSIASCSSNFRSAFLENNNNKSDTIEQGTVHSMDGDTNVIIIKFETKEKKVPGMLKKDSARTNEFSNFIYRMCCKHRQEIIHALCFTALINNVLKRKRNGHSHCVIGIKHKNMRRTFCPLSYEEGKIKQLVCKENNQN